MKNILVSVFFVMAATYGVSAQTAQTVYFELGGPGIASFNYDTRFKGQDGLGARIGVGGISSNGDAIVYIPIGLNCLLGKEGPHYFELGGGITPIIGDVDGEGVFQSNIFGHLVFGYRLQPINGGFSFRAFVCPVFGNGNFVPYYAGLSFGYKF